MSVEANILGDILGALLRWALGEERARRWRPRLSWIFLGALVVFVLALVAFVMLVIARP